MISLHFQTKDSDMHDYAHSWSPNDGDRNQQNNICFSYWLAIQSINITIFYWQVLVRQVKATNKTTKLVAHFFYNTILHWLTNLAISITFR